MASRQKATSRLRVLIGSSILLCLFLLLGQTLAVVDYALAVSLGLQESTEEVGKVGTAYAKGFALADTVFYIPILLAGIWAVWRRKRWGYSIMIASLSISVYWPIVHLYAIHIGPGAFNLSSEKIMAYTIILSAVCLYGLWGLWYIFRSQ